MIRVAIDFFSQCQSPKNCAIDFFSQCQSPKNCAIDFFSQCQSPKNCAIDLFSQCQSPKNCAIDFFSQCQSPKNCAIDFFSQCQSPKNCAIDFFSQCQSPKNCAIDLFSQCQSPKNCGSGPLPPLNSLQQQRQRQIESLKAAHSSLSEIQKDVEYRIPFTVKNATISVNILLPPQFPQEKPVVSVYPPVGHHLVDSNNGTMVTSPLITNFGMHSDLGKVIQSLLDEFWKSQPVLMSGPTGFPYNMYKPSGMPPYPTQSFHYGPRTVGPTPPSMPHAGVEGAHGHGPPWAAAPVYGLITDLPLPVPTADSQAGLNGHMYKMPEIPETFPELSEMSVSQLKDMSEQEDVLLELFVCLPQLKQVTTDKEELVNSIVDMAKKNLQLEPQLEGRRQEMLFKYEQLTQNKSAFETKMQRQHDISESCSLSALQARLKVAAHQAEEESEETAESFLEGKTDIDDFLANFMEKRTLCHSRRAKEEKLQQSINTHGQFPSSH